MAGGLAAMEVEVVEVGGEATFGGVTHDSGSDFWELPGASSWAEGGGDTPTRDVVAFGRSTSQAGEPRAQTVDIDMSAVSPLHRAARLVRAAYLSRSTLQFQLFTKRQVFLNAAPANVQLTVAANGTVTISDTVAGNNDAAEAFLERLKGSEFAIGMALEIKARAGGAVVTGDVRQIEENKAAALAGAMIVSGAGAIAATENFRITLPRLKRGPFTASITAADRSNARAEADLAGAVSLAAKGALPEWVVDIATGGIPAFTDKT